MYDELHNPELTCKGLLQTGNHWNLLSPCSYRLFCHLCRVSWLLDLSCVSPSSFESSCSQKAKHTVVVEETAFEKSKKRFHFATIDNDTKVPLLQAQM